MDLLSVLEIISLIREVEAVSITLPPNTSSEPLVSTLAEPVHTVSVAGYLGTNIFTGRSVVHEPGGEARIVSSRGGGGLGLARVFGGWLEPARAGSGRLRKDGNGDANSNTCCW